MVVSLPIKNCGRETCYRIHTHKLHALDDKWMSVWLHFQECESGGSVTALLLDNESSGNKLFQMTFPRDPCQMRLTCRWRQATATSLEAGSTGKRSEKQVSYPMCKTTALTIWGHFHMTHLQVIYNWLIYNHHNRLNSSPNEAMRTLPVITTVPNITPKGFAFFANTLSKDCVYFDL